MLFRSKPDNPEYLEQMKKTVAELKLEDKVTIISHFISQKEKLELLSKSLGCLYIPYHEDSYGYVTMESYQGKKPVISCTDSGDTYVLVKDKQTGFLVDSTPQTIAESIDKLYNDKKLAQRLGEDGYDHLTSLKITWENVVNKLSSA